MKEDVSLLNKNPIADIAMQQIVLMIIIYNIIYIHDIVCNVLTIRNILVATL